MRASRFTLLVLLALAGCKWNVSQFIAHPSIADRMADNLSGELPMPEPPVVNPDSFRFALFGDPQIGEDLLSQLGHFRHEVKARGIEFFGVIGDLTNDALSAEQQALKAALDSIAVPYYCTLGNHDLYQDDGWNWFKQNFGPSCYALEVGGKVRILFLDTAEGVLGREQFDWLERELADSSGLQTIVATHYPIYDGSSPIMYRLSSPAEQYKLLSLLSRYDVRYFVASHIHGWRYFRIDRLNHFVCSLPPGVMDYGKPGFLVFTWAHDSLSWEHVELDSLPTLP